MAATLVWKLTGGASNSSPNASLGGVRSSNSLSGTSLNNLFDDVSPSEASSGNTDYRAIDLYNSGDAAATSVVFYQSTETSSAGTTLDNGIEASPIDSITSISSESIAPVGVTFSHYDTGTRLTLPDIPSGSGCRIWFKRVVSSSTVNTSNDAGAFTVEYA